MHGLQVTLIDNKLRIWKLVLTRRHNWMEGLLITGGYREAGAWLNTAYWLNLTAVFDPSLASTPSLVWERVTNISPMFDGGRHNHALSTTAML